TAPTKKVGSYRKIRLIPFFFGRPLPGIPRLRLHAPPYLLHPCSRARRGIRPSVDIAAPGHPGLPRHSSFLCQQLVMAHAACRSARRAFGSFASLAVAFAETVGSAAAGLTAQHV